MEYLSRIPKEIPKGKILVHNHVAGNLERILKPHRQPGPNGFRIWFDQDPTDNREACLCGWAPELGNHYIVKIRQAGP